MMNKYALTTWQWNNRYTFYCRTSKVKGMVVIEVLGVVDEGENQKLDVERKYKIKTATVGERYS